MRIRATALALALLAASGTARSAHAQDVGAPAETHNQDQTQTQSQDQDARPKAIEYSEGYEKRAKIHKVASYATLPLLATEAYLGTQLYNDPQGRLSSYKTPHIIVGTAITGLFAVNTVTGVWNLVEGWKEPEHRTIRLTHGILMLASDVGFVAAYGTGPGGRNLTTFDTQKNTHRTVVFTTMAIATAGYLLMLFGNH